VVVRQNVFFDYLDVDDLGRILECFLRKDLRHRHYNICAGHSRDLKTLAGQVVAASGKPLEILVKNEGLGDEYSGDNARLLEEIPGFRFREMDDSIARLYQWYEARKGAIDPALLHFDG
jgi:GDP-L-fucose synthase